MLEKFGCKVDVAMTGAEAFQKFEHNSYDLILLDIQLPDTTGTAIAQELLRRYKAEEIDYLPLMIALTANIMQTKADYQQQGMDDVLRKPISLEALSTCLHEHFGDMILPISAKNSPLVDASSLPYNPQIVQELLSVMGKTGVLANLVLFEQLMPNYLKELNDDFARWQQDNSSENRKKVADQAHKIKGAFSSVGLNRLQEIAQLAQSDDGKRWEGQISSWILQMQNEWKVDLASLRNFIS